MPRPRPSTLRAIRARLFLAAFALSLPGPQAALALEYRAADAAPETVSAEPAPMAVSGLEAVPDLSAPLSITPAAVSLMGVGPALAPAALRPAALAAGPAAPSVGPEILSRAKRLAFVPERQSAEMRHSAASRDARGDLQDIASGAAARLEEKSGSSAGGKFASDRGFDRIDAASDRPQEDDLPTVDLLLADNADRSRYVRLGGNQSAPMRVLQVVEAARGAGLILKVRIDGGLYAAKFNPHLPSALKERDMLRDIDAAYVEDGVEQRLPGFQIQRFAPVEMQFKNDEGAAVPVIFSRWADGRRAIEFVGEQIQRQFGTGQSYPLTSQEETRQLYMSLKDLENNDFWKGMQWLSSRGFAVVDMKKWNLLVSLPECVITIVDFASAIRRPSDPTDSVGHTRFERAARIWQRKLNDLRQWLQDSLS
ncbi:MAG: hypothetical protein HY552_04765 [Elusimicrobia bacterium]|nr:hypothetical protein [Elusimicrobiota bacterium]